MAGHSNGCMAAIATATLHSDMVAAVGCHAGTALAAFPDSYKPTPMWLVHGMEDDTVSFDGDDFFLGQMSIHSLIAQANGCKEYNENQIGDGVLHTSTSCDNGANVTLLSLTGVGHTPYSHLIGVDTTQLAWDFVSSFSLTDTPILVAPETVESPPTDEPSLPTSSSSKAKPMWPISITIFGTLLIFISMSYR